MPRKSPTNRARPSLSAPEDGRFVSTAECLRHEIVHSEPRLAYREGMTRAGQAEWRRRVRDRLRAILNLPRCPAQPPPQLLTSDARDGYRLQRWVLYPEPRSAVPFLALVPDSATRERPAPAVLCFPGTDHSMELLAGEPERAGWEQRYHKYPERPAEEAMGLLYVRAGMVAICLDNPATQSTRDTRWPGRTELSAHLILLGRSYPSLTTLHARALYRWVRRLPFVNPARIAVSGHSLGTWPALLLAVLDPRISAVVCNAHLGTVRDQVTATGLDGQKLWSVIPGMLNWFERPDLAAALAPRPLLISEGGAPWHLRRVQRAYRDTGAADSLKIVYNPAYVRRASRRHAERLSAPPCDVTNDVYKAAVCQDSANHYFKGKVAVPWLKRMLAKRKANG